MSLSYQFLDWFKPTNIWRKKIGGKIMMRYRFEKLGWQEPSWWMPSGESEELPEVTDNIAAKIPFQSPCLALCIHAMDDQIGRHDTAEECLGLAVATMSGGCPAEMMLQMHQMYFRG
jgi:hypothetical protein